jgi:hypothetical protein
MSKNPYAQVALTYVRRPLSSLAGVIISFSFVMLTLGLLIFLVLRTGDAEDFHVLQLMPFVFLFLYLTAHAKDQFADPRAHLTPRFRRVHGTIAAAAAMALAVLLPATMSWRLGWHSTGFVALTLLLLGTILWSVLLFSSSLWPMLSLCVGFLLLGTEAGRGWAQQLVCGRSEPQAVAILVLGAAITLRGAIRLMRLNEDMREYNWIKWDRARGRAEPIGEQSKGRDLAAWLTEWQMARLTQHALRAPGSPWSRIYRWPIPSGISLSGCVFAITMILILEIARRVLPKPTPPGLLCFMCLLFWPPFAAMVQLLQRARTLAYELLLPVDRRSCLRQAGMGALLCQLGAWGTMGIVFFFWLLATHQPYPLPLLADAILISAAAQACTFGMAMWAARLGHPARTLSGMAMGLAYAVGMSFQTALRNGAPPPPVPPVYAVVLAAVILIAVGILLTWTAYRRWLAADLD